MTEIPFGIFMKSLELAQETSPGGGMPTPRVTFTGMSQLRPLPYKIIAVVSLNEDCAFPGNPHRQEFDLMAHAARRGDRDSRRDNRNVFLDILLAARRTLLISYVCGTGAGSAERQPSVVAQELREWLLTFAPGRAERRRAEALLTVNVPLNAYSTESFRDAGRGWRSHDPALFEALRKAVSAGYRSSPILASRSSGAPKSRCARSATSGRRLPGRRWLRPASGFRTRQATTSAA